MALPGSLSSWENAVVTTQENMDAEAKSSSADDLKDLAAYEEQDLALLQSSASTSIVSEQIISLLEERLVVDRRKHKVSEVVFRKEIETRIVEVPIRREKLIVEQVSPEYKQLAVIDLGQASAENNVLEITDNPLPNTVNAEFTSARAAIQFLEAMVDQSNPGLQRIQVSIISEDAAL
jgi:Domain of unknown function (DUF2382)